MATESPVQSFAPLDEAVAVVRGERARWAQRRIRERIALIRECIAACVDESEAIVLASCAAKGLDPASPASAEEWMAGPIPIVRNLRLLAETLGEIDLRGVRAFDSSAIRRTPTGELAATVFPANGWERLFYPGVRIDVWMMPDVNESNLARNMASAYREDPARRRGAVALVLGAGNVASIGPMDVLYKLFVENRVVVLKMHPVNAYLGPIFERALRPLIRESVLRIVYGDAAEGRYLVDHAGVDEIHMTGSAAVHDRIVWGESAAEQDARRARREPLVAKPMTSELGCVTPVIVVPGSWSTGELEYHAENVATMVAHNASCNCNAAKLLVTWAAWPARDAFLDRVRAALRRCPGRRPYYPGAAEKQAAFANAYPEAERLETGRTPQLPFVTIFGIHPDRSDARAFAQEAWSPVLAETPLDAADEAAFLSAAVRFCNERVAGTLSAIILASGRARRRLGPEFDRAIQQLRYGTIGVNHWSAVGFALAVAPWGAYPGHTLDAVGSGIGVVHNTRMFDRPLKAVLWGPFVARPRPVWFTTHRTAHRVARRMVRFEAAPSWRRVPGIIAASLPAWPRNRYRNRRV